MSHRSGVLGKGISYSLSPKIHKLFAEAAGIDLNYEIYDLEHDPIPFIYNFFNKGGIGLNITKPYKEIVAKEFSKNLDSVNCLYGKDIHATSTDGSGFITDIESKDIRVEDKNILLFGLGGAGKAILKELKGANDIYIASRNKDKVKLTIQNNEELKEYSGEEVDLFISCAERFGLEALNLIQNINFKPNSTIYDINYKNETNIILSELGIIDEARLYNGLGMLVEQAAASFEHWFEHRPDTENIKKILSNE
tara:strand:- start:196 stop:951 length:756 start_codon:yes stop_codon:yes gene_type:complete